MVIRTSDDLAELATASEVIDALGGTAAAAALAARVYQSVKPSLSAVSNWRKAGRLPAATFLVFTTELAGRGYRASPTLWSIAPASAGTDGGAS